MNTKQYNVYGIGNALVDINVEVSEATLDNLNIEKGVMTLIDESRELALLEEIDGVKRQSACGGSAANTMITLCKLGAKGYYSCKVANDPSGDFYVEDLLAAGLETNLSNQAREDGRTGKCLVLVTPDADRTMNTYLGVTAGFATAQLDEAAILASQMLYIEGYLIASDTAREAMHKAKRIALDNNIQTSITLSDVNMVRFFKNELLDVIADGVDFLFCNKEEALLFCETDDMDVAGEKLKAHAKQFAITLGADGALLYDGDRFMHIPGFETKVVDTVGAGDTFAGTLLYALSEGKDLREAGRLANYAASLVVSDFGPRLNAAQYELVKALEQKETILSQTGS